jgi:hypothetical protein
MMTSCFDRGDCLFVNTNLIKVNIKDKTAVSQPKQVVLSSVTMPDQGFLLYAQDTLSSLYLPADPRLTQTRYVFQYGERSDTLILSYSNQSIVLSPDCGTYLFQKDLAIQHTTFGENAVVIKNPQLLTTVPINIEIFL